MFGSRKPKKQARRRTGTRAEVTLVDMICPHCSADVLLNPETAEVVLAGNPGDSGGGDEAATVAKRAMSNLRAELFTVACPSCGEEFIWDTDANSDGDTGEDTTDTTPMGGGNSAAAQAKKPARNTQAKKPVAKKTANMRAEMAEAFCPECSSPVPYDTESAEIRTDESGVEGYALTCFECGADFIEPLESADPEVIPTGMSAQAAYRMGVRAERARIAALDEMEDAAPALSAMISAAKRSGASAQTMGRNVFRAMANNPAAKGRQQLEAMRRDAESGGVNGMRFPAHYNQKAQFNDMVAQRLEDRNQ